MSVSGTMGAQVLKVWMHLSNYQFPSLQFYICLLKPFNRHLNDDHKRSSEK